MTTTPAQKQTAEEKAALRAAGLRKLADLVEAHPELDATYLDDVNTFYAWTKEDVAGAIRAGLEFGAKVTKEPVGNSSSFETKLSWDGFSASVLGSRAQVCERVVVGTETVTKTVKDPEALAAVPEIEVTEEVEVVRWDCRPILDGEPVPSVVA
jgi:hypothetical protein